MVDTRPCEDGAGGCNGRTEYGCRGDYDALEYGFHFVLLVCWDGPTRLAGTVCRKLSQLPPTVEVSFPLPGNPDHTLFYVLSHPSRLVASDRAEMAEAMRWIRMPSLQRNFST